MFLQGPVGRLEALVAPGDPDRPCVVIGHPHPLYGGTMRNRVVYWLARAFEDLGFGTVRFNFRGVEKSEGKWGEGEGEAEDVRAVVDWAFQHLEHASMWLAGFSFGCYAALRAGREDPRIARFVAIAPAVNHWDFSFFLPDERPIFVAVGERDEIVPADAVRRWALQLSHASFVLIPGADHFFKNEIDLLIEALTDWAKKAL